MVPWQRWADVLLHGPGELVERRLQDANLCAQSFHPGQVKTFGNFTALASLQRRTSQLVLKYVKI